MSLLSYLTFNILFRLIFIFSFSFLQFFPTADEAIDYYNQKRCVDGKALILPSQIVSRLIINMHLLQLGIFCITLISHCSLFSRGMSNILSMS